MRDYKNMTDAELLRLSSENDERAFEALYSRYESLVYNLAYFKVKNRADALDVAQEAFMKLWQRAASYRGEGSVSAFIHTIVKNAATDCLRRREAETVPLTPSGEDGEEHELQVSDEGDTPEEASVRREKIEEVRRAIGELSDDHREVIVMYDIDGKSYVEIAVALGVDIGTVKSRLFRARKKLREILLKGNKTDR